ncbi:hypothetical protein TYRP_023051 [Tyrophagus putrescentiae]|nr:hypothetical protein TYRP_023051 [Tyrophagus putrescentiae]
MFQHLKRLLLSITTTTLPSFPSITFLSSLLTLLLPTLLLLSAQFSPSNQSIGYFESYGWPSYGIVKPFWLQPFSSYPTEQTSGYSRSAKTISAGVVRNRPGMNRKSMGLFRRRRR